MSISLPGFRLAVHLSEVAVFASELPAASVHTRYTTIDQSLSLSLSRLLSLPFHPRTCHGIRHTVYISNPISFVVTDDQSVVTTSLASRLGHIEINETAHNTTKYHQKRQLGQFVTGQCIMRA